MRRLLTLFATLPLGVAALAQSANYCDANCQQIKAGILRSEQMRRQNDQAAEDRRRDAEREQRNRSQPSQPSQLRVPATPPPVGSAPLDTQEDVRVAARRAAEFMAAIEDLKRAVLSGDDAKVALLLNTRTFGSVKLDRGITLLMVAAQRGRTDTFAGLAKIDPGAVDQTGNLALHHLVADGQTDALGLLLDATGTRMWNVREMNACNSDGWSALTLATALGKDALALALLKRGADPHRACAGAGEPPLVVAAALGRVDVVDTLLSMGVDPAMRGMTGLTAMQAMASRPTQERLAQSAAAVVARMRYDMALAAGGKAAAAPWSAPPAAPLPDSATMARTSARFALSRFTLDLAEGATTGQVDLVRKALAAGADPRARSIKHGGTPMQLAARGDRIDVLDLLLTPAVAGDKEHMFATLVVAADSGATRAMDLLIRRGGLDDTEGRLSDVMRNIVVGGFGPGGGNVRSAEVLLAAGVKPDDRVRSEVLYFRNVKMLKALLAAGMDVRSPIDSRKELDPYCLNSEQGCKCLNSEQGCTTLMVVSARGDAPEMVQTLIDAGVDVNARSSLGRSALWYATKNGRQRNTQVLLKAGADPNVADAQSGTTPLMLESASTTADPETVQRLIDAGADVQARSRDNRPVSSPVAQVQVIIQRARAVQLARAAAPPVAISVTAPTPPRAAGP